jgi:hypothetical protein
MGYLAQKLKLCTSEITGRAYITNILKNGKFGKQGRPLDNNEVYDFIINFIEGKLEDDENLFHITGKEGKPILTIQIFRENKL